MQKYVFKYVIFVDMERFVMDLRKLCEGHSGGNKPCNYMEATIDMNNKVTSVRTLRGMHFQLVTTIG